MEAEELQRPAKYTKQRDCTIEALALPGGVR